jgi:glutamate-1-semialdehyde 2,1-aminomutase
MVGNPLPAAAGLATLAELEKSGFYESLHARSDDLLRRLQAVLDRHELTAIAAGAASFWQFLFLESEPGSYMDIVHSDRDTMRPSTWNCYGAGSMSCPASAVLSAP